MDDATVIEFRKDYERLLLQTVKGEIDRWAALSELDFLLVNKYMHIKQECLDILDEIHIENIANMENETHCGRDDCEFCDQHFGVVRHDNFIIKTQDGNLLEIIVNNKKVKTIDGFFMQANNTVN